MSQEIHPCITYTTKRLDVRPWAKTLANFDAFQALKLSLGQMLTKPVLQHLPQQLQLADGPAAVADWITERDKQAAIHLISDSGGLVGLMFLFRPNGGAAADPLHLGYLFGETAWGKGYASEMVAGLVAALSDGPVMTLQGGVAVENPASAKVLLKAGFRRWAKASTDELEIFHCTVGSTAPATA